MDIDYGFTELFAKNDKMMGRFFKESNNRDILGLYKMNVRISNVLFPFGNTLMPNLVYFYYLNAIYYVLKEIKGREPYRHEIDEWEVKISKTITNTFADVHKGFLDTAANRAYAKYKSSMERMHFIGNKGADKAEKWKAWPELQDTALECLKKTKRYQFVKRVMDNTSGKVVFSDEEKKEKWPYRLESIERLDFIRRVVVPYENDFVSYSVFANVVMYYSNLWSEPVNHKYSDAWMDEYDEKRKLRDYFNHIAVFDQMIRYCQNVEKGFSRVDDYRIARVYSKLQLIAKLVYKICLFKDVQEKQNEYKKQVDKEIRMVRREELKEITIELANGVETNEKYLPFIKVKNGTDIDNELLDSFRFVGEIAKCIVGRGSRNEKFKDYIERMKTLVIEREAEVMGDNSILNSGIRAEHTRRDSEDTFRWQYRPDYIFMDGGNMQDEEDVAATNKKKSGSGKNDNAADYVWKKGEKQNHLSPMSASYYIYELFFEPYEN